MKITGTVLRALPVRSGVSAKTGNEWKSQDVIIGWKEDGYDQSMIVNAFSDRVLAEIEAAGRDDEYYFNVRFGVREYNDRWYNGCKLWSMVPVKPAPEPPHIGGEPYPKPDRSARQVYTEQLLFAAQPKPTPQDFPPDDLPF